MGVGVVLAVGRLGSGDQSAGCDYPYLARRPGTWPCLAKVTVWVWPLWWLQLVWSTAGFLGCTGMWYGSGLGLGWMASVRLQEDGSLGDDENVK